MSYGPHNPDATYAQHGYPEAEFDTGEVILNYATTGSADNPALLLIPAQAESWWGYEAAMNLLEDDFEVFAVDLRGQGRSTRTPGRYTLDTMGSDVVRFISGRVRRPVVVAGMSSGGVIAAWLSAYAPPGMLRGAYLDSRSRTRVTSCTRATRSRMSQSCATGFPHSTSDFGTA